MHHFFSLSQKARISKFHHVMMQQHWYVNLQSTIRCIALRNGLNIWNEFQTRLTWPGKAPVCDYLIFQRPALSLKIAEDYFNNNLSGNEDDFHLENGYYERTIPETDLNLEFGTTDDGKLIIKIWITENSKHPLILSQRLFGQIWDF